MKKKLIWMIGLVSILLLGIGGFTYNKMCDTKECPPSACCQGMKK